jgi:hypothetical protein
MKCSICQGALRSSGFMLTLVSLGPRTFTATVHPDCLRGLVGATNERKLTRLCIDSGWEQSELPGFATAQQ